MKNKWLLVLCILLLPVLANAGNLSFLAGRATSNQENEGTSAWQVEYEHRAGDYLGLSASYLNEGHSTEHKRDGLAAQLRIYAPIPSDRFSLSIGGGPYRWYDTQPTTISRGWAGLYGVTASYNVTKSVIIKTTWNRVESEDLRDSDVFLIGLGYSWK